MKLVPCENIHAIRSIVRNNNQAIIREFVDGEHDCVEVVGYNHKTACSCQASLRKTIVSLRMQNSIGVSIRGDHVYLYKKHYD